MIKHNNQTIIEEVNASSEENSDKPGEPLCMSPSSLPASTSTSQHATPKRQRGELNTVYSVIT